jgi:hypothetical protein
MPVIASSAIRQKRARAELFHTTWGGLTWSSRPQVTLPLDELEAAIVLVVLWI